MMLMTKGVHTNSNKKIVYGKLTCHKYVYKLSVGKCRYFILFFFLYINITIEYCFLHIKYANVK